MSPSNNPTTQTGPRLVCVPANTDLNADDLQFADSTNSKSERSIIQQLIDAKIHPEDDPPANQVAIGISDDGETSPLCTLGNFAMLMGKAKSKKTFLISLLVAVVVKGFTLFNKFFGSLPEGKKRVALFDTEQSKYHIHQVVKRVCRLIGIDVPDNFETFGLRQYDTQTRRQMIEYYIENTPGLGFVVIDGIRDLITDINDPQQATDIASWIMRLTDLYQIHILVVLHQNKGDANARGHVGSELTNKAETVLSVTKDPQNRKISLVEPEYCRDREFTPFAFYIDSNGLPALAEDHHQETESSRRPKTPYDYDPDFHKNVVRRVFEKQDKFRHSELVRQTQTILQSILNSIGESKTKNFIQYFIHMGYINKEGSDRSPNAFYSLGQLG